MSFMPVELTAVSICSPFILFIEDQKKKNQLGSIHLQNNTSFLLCFPWDLCFALAFLIFSLWQEMFLRAILSNVTCILLSFLFL